MTTLAAHDVRYVLVGALAARLQGFPRLTADMDITPSMEPGNLERLARALRSLDARGFTDGIPEGLPFDCSAETLRNATMWNLVTDAGRLDVIFTPAGTDGFADLARTAVDFEVFGIRLAAAALEDIVRTKEAADRPQDRQDVAVIRAMLRKSAPGAGAE